MKILVTGNMGYVGSVLVGHLRVRFPDAEIIGFDAGYFAHCLTGGFWPEHDIGCQSFGDVRRFPNNELEGVDAVVYLAALSNDPMGRRFERATKAINCDATGCIARESAVRGVKNFVFASSCSMYGAAGAQARRESDALHPMTAYACSKVLAEEDLAQIDSGSMTVTALRFATACGMSPRLRLDLVLNDFVACALATGEITVLSNGEPWRPLIDVKDMVRAIEWAVVRDGPRFLSVNVGSQNYQVRDLAQKVADAIPGTAVYINKDAAPDVRSYRVDFSLFQDLAPGHQPQVSLEQSISELKTGMKAVGFRDARFRESTLMRIKMLEQHIAEGRLDEELKWL